MQHKMAKETGNIKLAWMAQVPQPLDPPMISTVGGDVLDTDDGRE